MPRGQPQNLKPQAHKLTVEEASKGGKKSGEVRRAKKTIQTLLNDYLESNCESSPQFNALAEKMGLNGEDSIKQLFTIMCVLNTAQTGGIKDLAMLSELLGENAATAPTEEVEDDPLTKALKEEAEKMNNGDFT